MKRKIYDFICSLRFIFMPHYWVMSDGYNAAWDKKFQEIIARHDFIPDDELTRRQEFGKYTYTACLGEYRVWVSNYPYAFFSYCGKVNDRFVSVDTRPSRLTIHRAYRKLVKDLEKHNYEHR